MIRRLYVPVSALSLLLFVALGLMLVYWIFVDTFYDLRFHGPERTYAVGHYDGIIDVQIIGPFPEGYARSNSIWGHDPRTPSRELGFAHTVGPEDMGDGPVQVRFVQLPAAGIMVGLGLLPSIWIANALICRSRRRRRPGFCRNCGYDLRATPRQCPECGELVRR